MRLQGRRPVCLIVFSSTVADDGASKRSGLTRGHISKGINCEEVERHRA